jgi:butyrate kinase
MPEKGKKLGGCTGKGFMPGQTGNPGGRPKKQPITEILNELFADKEFVKKELRKVLSGKSGMAKVMLTKDAAERIEGRVTQPVEINGELTLTISERMRKAKERKLNHNG